MVERIYWVVSFQANARKGSLQILERQPQIFIRSTRPFFSLIPFTTSLFMSNFMERVVDLTTLHILRTARAMLMNFCIIITPRCQVLIWGAKYFACFSRFLPVERLFRKTDCIVKSNPLSTANLRSHPSLFFLCN